MNQSESSFLQVLETYKSAVYAKDVETFLSLYDPDVEVFDMWGQWSYRGASAWRKMVAEWFTSLGDERVKVQTQGLKVLAADNIAVLHAFVTFTGESAEGKELRSMQNRFTWTLRNLGGSWKIIHEHSSAPADFETSKVMLQP